jgi:hypothetical protein
VDPESYPSPDEPRRRRILELGPAWIGSIATLIAALTAAGLFAVHSGDSHKDPGPPAGANSTPTTIGGQGGTATPATTTPTATTPDTTGVAPGTQLVSFSVDLSDRYGIVVGATTSRPTPDDLVDFYQLNWVFFPGPTGGTIASSDKQAPGYEDCRDDTRFDNQLEVQVGNSFCYLGHGMVAAVMVKHREHTFVTIQVTVWQG